MRSLLAASLLLVVPACGDNDSSGGGVDPDTAPISQVDRFSDSFAHLFKRSGPAFDPVHVQPIVPAANAPIDLDALFTVRSLGPNGADVSYYSLDILPRAPARAWVIMRAGAAVAGQLPIIDGLPGDTGYNDFVRINEVTVGGDYVANLYTSADDVTAAVAAGDATVTETTRIANWAVVPAGTMARRTFEGRAVTGARAWNKGEVSTLLRFEEDLTVTAAGTVPVAQIVVIFENNMSPAAGFAMEADGMTHNAIDTTADQPGYSSLWNHSVGNKANFAAVHDYPSALANVMAANVGVDVNCPEVR